MEEIRSVVFSTEAVMIVSLVIATLEIVIGIRDLLRRATRRVRIVMGNAVAILIVLILWWVAAHTGVI